MKEKRLFKILIILTIILIALVILLIKNERNKDVYTEMNYEEFFNDKIMPSGSFHLIKNYKGENDTVDFYTSLYKFANYLPIIQRDINDKNIEEYYLNNGEIIKKNLGISKYEEFETIAIFLNEVDDIGEYTNSKIESESFSQENNYLLFNLVINFSKLEKDLKVKVRFANNYSTNIKVKYTIIKE